MARSPKKSNKSIKGGRFSLFAPIPRGKHTAKKVTTPQTKSGMLFEWNELLSAVLIFVGFAGAMNYAYQIKKADYISAPIVAASLPVEEISVEEKPDMVGLSHSEPVRVNYSKLGIDYGVKNVGKLEDGTMETPPLFEPITGWYKFSPTPGEVGPSIIVGHVDTYKGPSVFWRLREARAGDVIAVTRKDGKIVKFKVQSVKSFEQNDFPTKQVYGNLDYPGLRLITCGGTFNDATQRYSHNTVVFAKMIT